MPPLWKPKLQLREVPGQGEFLKSRGLSLSELDGAFARGTVVSQSSRGRVHFVPGTDDSSGIFVKIFLPRGKDLLRAIALGSDPLREYRSLCFLRDLGIPVVKPLAVGVQRRFGMPRSAFLITEAVAHGQNLDAYLTRLKMMEPSLDKTRRDDALRRFAVDIGRMHQSGFVDGDLHFRNVLVVEEAAVISWAFLDHPRSRVLRAGTGRHADGIAHDLACLDKHAPKFLRRTERLRFFKAYVGHQELNREDKTLLRAIEKRRQKLLRKREAKLRQD